MRKAGFQPQIAQMNADVFLNAFICASLRHLRLNNPDMSLREFLEKIGV